MRVLVTGATGFVGGNLVPALVEVGHDVVAMTRHGSGYDPPQGVDVVEADLLEPSTLEGVFDDVDAAYYLVHSLRSGADFAERDRRAARNFVEASRSTGLDRVVYLAGLGETGDDLSEHLRSRREVEEVLSDGDYDLTTLRAAVIIGSESAGFRMVKQLVERLPVMTTPAWVRTPCQPIAISDVVEYLVGVLDAPETRGGTYEIGGPEVLSYEEMIRRTADALGRSPIIIRVPLLTLKLSTYWVDFVTDVPRSVVHPLIHGMKNPVVVNDDTVQDYVDVEPTPFSVAVERALSDLS
ncbi:MAG: NAD(P)H-binding protein [Halobacteria archaeon]|nr:NAD(P)H-binding protein [Halobacteria archaeon]